MSKIISVGLLMLLCSSIQAQGIRAVLGEDSVRFIYITEAWGQEIGSFDVEAGVLATGSDETLLHIGVLVQNRNVSSTLKLSVGARGYYSSINNENASFLAFGGDLTFVPENWEGFGIGASYFLAPSFTTFSATDSFSEFNVSIQYQITPQGFLSLGYQNIKVQLTSEASDRTLESGAFIGLGFDF